MNAQKEYSHITHECVCCGSEKLARSPAILMPFVANRIYQWEPVLIDDSWGLKTIQNGYAYPLCNSLLCKNCDLLFLDIRFSNDEMARLYDDYRGAAYTLLRDKFEPGYAERNEKFLTSINYLSEVEAFLKTHAPSPITILDWGGDTGVNTPFRMDPQNTVHVYDISGIDTMGEIKKVSLRTARLNTYKLVVCSNVLEHVPRPLDLLLEIRSVMTSDSILYLEIPLENHRTEYENTDELLNKKRHWHEHINFFSASSIQHLLKCANLIEIDFKVLVIYSEGVRHHQFMVACKLSPP